MPETSSFLQLVEQGGITTMVLLALSVISIAVAVRKLITFAGAGEGVAERLTERVLALVQAGDLRGALHACNETAVVAGMRVAVPVATVYRSMLESPYDPGPLLMQTSLARLDREALRLERGLGVLATLGSVSPFIGLFGTVVGVIRAFDALAVTQTAGLGPVMSGIAEALVSTAAGLLVAVPAVVFYNYFSKRLKRSLAVSEQGVLEVHAALESRAPTAAPYASLSY